MSRDDDAFWDEMGEDSIRGRRARATAERAELRTDEPPHAPLPGGRREAVPVGSRPTNVSQPDAADEPRRAAVIVGAAITGFVWLIVMLLRLFVGGSVGLADQGDGRQLVCTFGAASSAPWTANSQAHVEPTPRHVQWWGESCGVAGSGEPYQSSQRILLNAAQLLTHPLGLPGTLDLRALGVICAVLVGIGVAAWVIAVPGRLRVRIVVASIVGLVYADSLVAPWFVSPYSEPAAMLGILFLGPALLWLWRSERTRWYGLVGVALLGLFTVTAAPNALALTPAVIVGLVWSRSSLRPLDPVPAFISPTGATRRSRLGIRARRTAHHVARFVRTRGVALAVAGGLAVGAGLYHSAEPSRARLVQKYNAFFGELIPQSPNGKADLRSFGLPTRLITASGTNIASPNAVTRTPEFDVWNGKVTMNGIWLVYARDPFRLVDLGSRGAQAMAAGRPNYLGQRMVGDAPASAKDNRIPVFLTVLRVWGKATPLFGLIWVLTLGWGWSASHKERYTASERAVGRLAVVGVLALTSAFWLPALTDGSVEFAKHVILADVLFALCFPLLVALRLTARRHRGDRPRRFR